MLYRSKIYLLLSIFAGLVTTPAVFAGVVNPDISVIGQVLYGQTNDKSDVNKNKATMGLGETEIQMDSTLNPYARGTFVFTIDEAGLGIEEAYMTVFNGLPPGLGIKAGKYRLGFGKLNPSHPHTYPFVSAPRVIAQFLPGDGGFNDVATQVSYLFPTDALVGGWASNLSVDLLNGSSFHTSEAESAMGALVHWSNSFLVNDITPIDIGVSATQGTNNVKWNTQSNVYGADIKTKIPVSVQGKLTLQSEFFSNDTTNVTDNNAGTTVKDQRTGSYFVVDYKVNTRFDYGAIYDQYQELNNKSFTDRAIKYFVGFGLLEESTLFRLTYEQFYPVNAPVVATVGLQLLYMMGPHKAHLF